MKAGSFLWMGLAAICLLVFFSSLIVLLGGANEICGGNGGGQTTCHTDITWEVVLPSGGFALLSLAGLIAAVLGLRRSTR